MIDREQQTERSEAAIMAVFDNQFHTLTNQIINNMRRLSTVGDRWPPVLLVVLGAILIAVSIAMKVGVFGRPMMETTGASVRVVPEILGPMEFMTMVLVGGGLMLAGALFSLYQGRSLRKIIQAQQLVGTEILNKQIDIEKDMIVRNQSQQSGQLILLPGKKGKRFRR